MSQISLIQRTQKIMIPLSLTLVKFIVNCTRSHAITSINCDENENGNEKWIT